MPGAGNFAINPITGNVELPMGLNNSIKFGGNGTLPNANPIPADSSTAFVNPMDRPTFNGQGVFPGANPTPTQPQTPSVEGKWMDKGNFGLGVAKVGLGVYNALEQSKMNSFMRSYYGNQMDLQKTDFGNAAKSTNETLAHRQMLRLDGQGIAADSEENKAAVADYMKKWGVSETF